MHEDKTTENAIDKFSKSLLIDTGEGYAFQNGSQCSYGKLLLALAYLSQGSLVDAYREILEKSHNRWLLDKGIKEELTEEEKNTFRTMEKIAEIYPIPEYIDKKYSIEENTLADILAIIDKNVLSYIEDILHQEMLKICNDSIEDVDKTMPAFLADNNFKDNIENMLIGNEIQEKDINKYCRNQMLSFTVQSLGGRMVKIYSVSSIMQLVAIELLAIAPVRTAERNKRNKSVKYSRCPICHKVFEQGKGRGQTKIYCGYQYIGGLCADKDKSTEYDVRRTKFRNKIHHYLANHREFVDACDWLDEYDELHYKLIEREVGTDEYDKEVGRWYDGKKKELKQQCASDAECVGK